MNLGEILTERLNVLIEQEEKQIKETKHFEDDIGNKREIEIIRD